MWRLLLGHYADAVGRPFWFELGLIEGQQRVTKTPQLTGS